MAYMLADNCQIRLRDLLHFFDDVSKGTPIHVLKHNRDDTIVVKGMVTHHHIRKLGRLINFQLLDYLLSYCFMNVHLNHLHILLLFPWEQRFNKNIGCGLRKIAIQRSKGEYHLQSIHVVWKLVADKLHNPTTALANNFYSLQICKRQLRFCCRLDLYPKSHVQIMLNQAITNHYQLISITAHKHL